MASEHPGPDYNKLTGHDLAIQSKTGTSHVDHEKIVMLVFTSMHACDPVPIVMVLHLMA